MSQVIVVFALYIETRGFLRALDGVKGDCGSYTGRIGGTSVHVGVCGVGPERSAAKASELLSETKPSALIAAGFAGILDDRLRAGDLVVAESVVDASAKPAVTYACDSRLLELAPTVSGCRTIRGRLLTVGEVAGQPAEKAKLLRTHGCTVVDMESGPTAALARTFGVPFVAVRAAVDRGTDSIPAELAGILEADGGVHAWRAAAAFIRHPGHISRALRLGQNSRPAARNLARFLGEYVQRIG